MPETTEPVYELLNGNRLACTYKGKTLSTPVEDTSPEELQKGREKLNRGFGIKNDE